MLFRSVLIRNVFNIERNQAASYVYMRKCSKTSDKNATTGSLIGEHVFHPSHLGKDELVKILNVAKQFKAEGVCNLSKLMAGKNVAVFITNQKRSMSVHIILWTAAVLMGATVTPIIADWSKLPYKDEVGRLVSLFHDIILAEGYYCSDVVRMSEGSTVPVIYGGCRKFRPLTGLSHLMTIEEHFGKLEKLTLAWIGPGGPLLNSHMAVVPKFGIDIRFNCTADPELPVSPMLFEEAAKQCKIFKTQLIETMTATEAVKDADVIYSPRHENISQVINMKLLEQAKPDCVLLHELPRGRNIEPDVYVHPKNLAWNVATNTMYITMATIHVYYQRHLAKLKDQAP